MNVAKKPIAIVSPLLAIAALCSMSMAGAKEHDHSHDHAGQDAHVHGVVALDVAVDDHDLVLVLHAPLADIVGFEHAPTTDAQRKQAQEAVAKLRDAAQWFKPTASAACKLEDVDIDAEVLGEHAHGGSDHKHDHDHQHEKKHEEKHAQAKHDGHDHDDDEAHADLEATFTFHCDKEDALKFVDVELFKGFPSIQTINVQIAAENQQSKQTLTPGAVRVTLAR